MQTLKGLNDSELLTSTKTAVHDEKTKTLLVLEHLREIESRLLYAQLGYSSLFAYGVKELGYSEAEILARISAMRLSREIPEIKEAVQEGALSLTNLSMANSFFRKAEVTSVEEKRSVLKSLENKSTREGERILEERFGGQPTPEKISFVLTEENKIRLAAIQELTGISDPQKVFEYLLSSTLKKATLPRAPKANKVKQSGIHRSPTKSQKKAIIQRDERRCTYISSAGKRCEETRNLQFDHIKPYSKGGLTTTENLRLLCPAHNALAAKEIFGEKFQRYRRS